MRKVFTGYAISFNRRHGRHGYLYQNRYKSILCQEDEYLLELVRYIHLNPVMSWRADGVLRPWHAKKEAVGTWEIPGTPDDKCYLQ